MELKDFVKETLETLVQITQGVHESIVQVRESGGYTNPAVRAKAKSPDTSHFADIGFGRNVFLVDFDVAISVEEGTGTNAGAKLNVASLLSLNAGGESANKSTATNRISFKVPLALPVDPVTEEELKKREIAQAKQLKESLAQLNQASKSWVRDY